MISRIIAFSLFIILLIVITYYGFVQPFERFCNENPLDDKCLTPTEECQRDCQSLNMSMFRCKRTSPFKQSESCWCKIENEVKQIW